MIKSIRATNFQSWDNLDFTFREGITLIDGWNEDDKTSEGSGKSSILNALCWGLYGKLPKDVKIDEVIKFGTKSCCVVLEFSEFTVMRKRKPNDLVLILPEKGEVRGKDANETQKLIDNKIGLSFEAFCQSIYFAQNYDKKFISASQQDKVRILTESQDLSSFDRARKAVIEHIKLETAKATDLKHALELYSKDLILLEHQLQTELQNIERQQETLVLKKNAIKRSFEELEDDFQDNEYKLKEKLRKLTELNAQNLDTTEELENLEVLEKAKTKIYTSDYSNSVEELQALKQALLAKKEQYNQALRQREDRLKTQEQLRRSIARSIINIEKLELALNNPDKSCPTCGSTTGHIDLSHIEQELTSEVSYLREQDARLNEVKDGLKQPLPEIDNLEEDITSTDTILANLKKDTDLKVKNLNLAITEIRQLIKQKESASKEIAFLATEVVQLKTRSEKLDSRRASLEKEFKELESFKIVADYSKIRELEDEREKLTRANYVQEELLAQTDKFLIQLDSLKAGFKDVKTHIFNSFLREVERRANENLLELFEVSASLEMRSLENKIELSVYLDGKETSLGLLSGGQNRRFSLAMDLALAEAVNARCPAKLNLLILDEYFKDLSEQSMEKCLNLLQKKSGTVILIEHNSIFKTIVENTVSVILNGGTSRIAIS